MSDSQPPEISASNLRLFLILSRPIFLLGVMVVYAAGAGIAQYLGATIDWSAYLLGQLWVSLLQLAAQYLNEYFNAPEDQTNPNRTLLTGGSGALGPGKLPRRTAQLAAAACLAFLASLTVVLMAVVDPGASAYIVMGIALLGALAYSIPPVRLEASGYGELMTSTLVGFFVPAFAFILQEGELHRLVAMIGFPLVSTHMAMLIALSLPDYLNDLKHEKRTFLIRLGWQGGMLVHNILILSSYLLVLAAWAFGMPTFAARAGLLSLPVGLFQIWQMRRIADGAPVNWNALTIGAAAQFILTAYLLAFAFWTN